MDALSLAWTLMGAGLAYKLGARVARGGRGADAMFKSLAAALDLEARWGWGGERVLVGEKDRLALSMRAVRRPPELHLYISLDARARLPDRFRIRAIGGPSMRTGDTWLDGHLSLFGGPTLLSLLDPFTRLSLRAICDRGMLDVREGWIESALSVREDREAHETARAQIDEMIRLAASLSRSLAANEVDHRLARSAAEDPLIAFRLSALEALIERSADLALVESALRFALSSPEPTLAMFAARHLDDARSREVIRAVAGSAEAPHPLRAEALFHLAATEPARSFDLFERALDSPSDHVLIAAIGGLGQLELRFLPLLRIVDRAERGAGGAAIDAIEGLFSRIVEEEGAFVEDDARASVIAYLDDLRTPDERRRGRLSVARPIEGEGAVSVTEFP